MNELARQMGNVITSKTYMDQIPAPSNGLQVLYLRAMYKKTRFVTRYET